MTPHIIINSQPLSTAEVMTLEWAMTNLEIDINNSKNSIENTGEDTTNDLYKLRLADIRKKMKS